MNVSTLKMFFIRRVGSRGPGLTCRQKSQISIAEIFSRNSGDFPQESQGFPPAFVPAIFSRNVQVKIAKMCSQAIGSGAGADGAHNYTGPPQGPDEVLDSL
jgi:hypothetical protein